MAEKLNCIVIADNIRSGQNIGALFRNADAFGFSHIYLTGISPVPPNKEVLKTALGATESVAWQYFQDEELLIKWLKDNHVKLVVVEQTSASTSLGAFRPNLDEKYAIVLGNEVDGVSPVFIKNADLCVEIPQVGTKHSLNVSVCAGIVMWHFFKELTAI
ncbi:MAG: TrmH family RNA methyltransferase [Bacteroidetes bacterium]|nr:MAG: TrmH family RNA methyltransferase [Bacteroidota bacterium]